MPGLPELIDLRGRTAIVTGAAMGIGNAIATRLHEAGADVVIADLAREEADEAVKELTRRRTESALAVETDVSAADSVDRLVRATLERFGGIDILVNNAGIFPFVPLRELDEDTFMRVIDVNLRALYLCTRRVAEEMIARRRGGRIVNITSVDALHPSMVGLATYDASKHGAWGFTKNVALELAAHDIRVNAIAPGGVLTPGVMAAMTPQSSEGAASGEPAVGASDTPDPTGRIPMGRLGYPDEIGRVALFLASDLASYMTGSQVVVDGGMLLS